VYILFNIIINDIIILYNILLWSTNIILIYSFCTLFNRFINTWSTHTVCIFYYNNTYISISIVTLMHTYIINYYRLYNSILYDLRALPSHMDVVRFWWRNRVLKFEQFLRNFFSSMILILGTTERVWTISCK